MAEFDLRYGKGKIHTIVPDENILGVLLPRSHKKIDNKIDAVKEIERALENPIGTKPLKELLQPNQKVAIMVSDITRPAPTELLLTPILKQLEKSGIKDEDITILFGLGIHRPHTPEEQEKLLGSEIFYRYRNMDAKEGLPIRYLGKTSRGTPVEIYAPVADADFIIGTGNLDLHYAAGYASGAKTIMPGASSIKSIEIHHRFMLDEGSGLGKIAGNPFREDMEEIADIVGLDFIVSAVMTEEKELVQVVAGDFRLAHREGCKTIDEIYKVPIREKADIVVVSAGGFPKDINIYQSQKTIENAVCAVKDGGIVVMLSECSDGPGGDLYVEWTKSAKSLDEIIDRIKEKFVMGGHKAAVIAKLMKKADIYAVTSIDPRLMEQLNFYPKLSMETAIKDAIKEKGTDAKIWIIPYGCFTLPVYE